MIGRVNTGGGGNGKFAAIGVTYPQGSICTCTDGVKTFKAKDTSGSFLFGVPYASTWTITATDGTETASVEIEITAQWQVVSVEISYRLPSIYQAVEYLEATGTQYINTNVKPFEGKIVADLSWNQFVSNNICWALGVNVGDNYEQSLYVYNDGLIYARNYFANAYGKQLILTNKTTPRTQKTITMKISNEEASLSDGTETKTVSGVGTFVTQNNTFAIFGRHNSNGTFEYNRSYVSIYGLKFYDTDNKLIHDFVPCYRKADNVAGLWDSIGKVFYTNAGSGTFVVGGNV